MKYSKLGDSDINVSRIALGTMTFGEQNSLAQGHHQLDYALEQGVNFIDTAELYAIPPRSETYGKTEEIIGHWIHQRHNRDKIVLASKVCGPGSQWLPHIRQGKTRLDNANIRSAIEATLQRLQTDYLDLYQLHWPDRATNFFGKLGYQPHDDEIATPILETLELMQRLVDEGKIRTIGLSNETAWGVMKYLQHAHTDQLSRVISVQNPYSLLNRSFEIGLAEVAHRESVGLLAYSPLGFGVLSGKYLNHNSPPDARLTLWPDYNRYSNPQAIAATTAYVALAKQYHMEPSQMALAFVNSRPFVSSTIIGATTMTQLQSNIEGCQMSLSPELLEKIETIHIQYPNPAP